jgi:hypothetical protein
MVDQTFRRPYVGWLSNMDVCLISVFWTLRYQYKDVFRHRLWLLWSGLMIKIVLSIAIPRIVSARHWIPTCKSFYEQFVIAMVHLEYRWQKRWSGLPKWVNFCPICLMHAMTRFQRRSWLVPILWCYATTAIISLTYLQSFYFRNPDYVIDLNLFKMFNFNNLL